MKRERKFTQHCRKLPKYRRKRETASLSFSFAFCIFVVWCGNILCRQETRKAKPGKHKYTCTHTTHRYTIYMYVHMYSEKTVVLVYILVWFTAKYVPALVCISGLIMEPTALLARHRYPAACTSGRYLSTSNGLRYRFPSSSTC